MKCDPIAVRMDVHRVRSGVPHRCLSHARSRRALGAVVGGFVSGAFATAAAAIGQALGLWQIVLAVSVAAVPALYVAVAVSCTPIPLVSWRIARRFGVRELLAMVTCAAVVSPIRDYRVATQFPDWIVFAPGLWLVLVVATIYAGIVAVGHATMYIIAGRSMSDVLARVAPAA